MRGPTDNIEDIYELSPMQEGMLYHTLQAPGAGVYVEQLVCTIRGAVDRDLFARAWQAVVDRHPTLRTAFVWEGLDKPLQAVRREAVVEIEDVDWRALAPDARAGAVDALVRRDRERGFALDRAPLMRLTLARLADDRTQFLWSHHHLLLDGWSVPLVLQDAAATYDALARGAAPPFESRRPYRDYIVWLRSRDLKAAERAWRAELADLPPAAPLPLARASAGEDRAAETITSELRLPEAETRAAETFARDHGLTLNTVVLGAWGLLVGAFASAGDVLVGSSVSGRPADLDGSDRMVGLFINSLPARLKIDAARPVAAWLRDLQARQAVLREHDATPLVAIRKWLDLPAGVSLFDSLLVFVNYPVDRAMAASSGALAIEDVRGFERSSMPLTVFAVPGRELGLKMMSDSARYDRATLAELAKRLRTILANLVADPDRALGRVPLVDAGELRRALVEWDAPREPVPATAAHQLFEEHAALRPDATAVVCGDATITYGELNERANRLARRLRALGAGTDGAVALSVDRAFDMIVGAVAILKAGGTYVPIDPGFPPARIALMLEASAATVVVTDEAHLDVLPVEGRAVVCLDRDRDAIAGESGRNLDVAIDPAAAAYVIFTSGSTGMPKGAVITHAALTNLLVFMRRTPGLSSADRMLAIATMSFDLAVLELCLPLASGAAIVVADRQTAADGRRLQALLRSADVTVMQGTPSTWRLLMASDWDGRPPLKMLTGGEPLPAGLAAEMLARGTSVWNLYGPTETTIYSTWRLVGATGAGEARDAIEPIGRPMPNQPHYILDQNLRPVPIGVTGEIYIGGVSVARGYASRPDLTADRFVPDPFSAEPGARMYRSGDLARFRDDGVMVSAGRADFQVKIRGYRVELGEIEATLERLPGIAECLVVARADEPDERRLVAYIRREAGADVDVAAARAALRERLPEYMVPAVVVVLDEFPRLPNGKPDRKRLPAPGAARPDLQVPFEPPSGDAEETVARLWRDVLKLDRVGANDNFFDVGGHSLLAVRLFGKLRETFGREIELVDLFTYPTVRAMASFLTSDGEPIAPMDETDDEGASGRDRLSAQRARRHDAADERSWD